MLKHLRALILLCFVANVLSAQQLPQLNTEVYGKITDSGTKEPLEYVNIRFIGSLRATLSNPKGEYMMKTIEKVDSISFSYLGYKTVTVAIKKGATQELNIEMGSNDVELKEVTVKAGRKRKREIDTTANYVYYKVVANKANNDPSNTNSYHYKGYDKLLVSLLNPGPKFLNFILFRPFSFAFKNRDTTETGDIFIPGLLKETSYEVYYRKKPKTLKSIIKGETLTGIDNPSMYQLADEQFAVLDLYASNVLIANKAFMAPFANNAITFYYYYLTDTALLDGRVSYKLNFVGKVKEDVALKGYAWIDSATWAIKTISVRPNEKSNLNFVNSHNVYQEFTYVDNKQWMLSREDVHSVGSLLKKKGKLKILITKSVTRKDFEFEGQFADSIFKNPDSRVLLDSARKRPETFWDTSRYEPLTPQEKMVYFISDTIKQVPAWKTYMWFGKFFTAAYAQAGPIDIGRVLNFASRNNVEGWRLRFGFRTNTQFMNGKPANDFFRKFYFMGYVAYGLKDRDWKYQALTRIGLPRTNDRWQSLEFMFRYDMRVPGQDENNTVLSFDNIVTLISGRTLSRIMKVREFRIAYEKEWVRNFSTIAMFNEKTYYDIPGVFDFIRNEDGIARRIPNFNITEFALDSRYAYKDRYFFSSLFRSFQTTIHPVFMLRYSANIVNMQGKYSNFHTLHFTYKQKIQSPSFGYTKLQFKAGKMFGKAPYTAAYITQGNLGILLDKFNYGLLREFEFISDQYASLWVEHHFDGFFLNKIPGVNKLRIREVIFARSLIGTYDYNKHNQMLETPHELGEPFPIPYVEVGFGFENILQLFRVDFMWRATYRNRPGVPNWGVKFAFTPNF